MDGIAPSDSVYSRLIQPLTTEIDGASVILVPVAPDVQASEGIEALIVPGGAVLDGDVAVSRVEQVARSGAVVVLDLGDGGDLISLAAATQDADATSRLRSLSAMSREVWTPSEAEARGLPLDSEVEIITLPSALDQRLWTTYRRTQTSSAQRFERVRLLYTARNRLASGNVGFSDVIVDAASDADAELILVGLNPPFPKEPWIRRVDVPNGMAYPRYVRWLRSVAVEADIGIVVADRDSDQSCLWEAHVDEYLAFGLVPMVVDGRGRLTSDCRGMSSSIQSSSDPKSALHSFAADPEFRATVRAEADAARSEMWATRGAALLGRNEVTRLIGLIDPLPSS